MWRKEKEFIFTSTKQYNRMEDQRCKYICTILQVGFDAGDGVNFFVIDSSRKPEIINVTMMSNIGVPGKFLFRVDSADIEKDECNINGIVYTIVLYLVLKTMFIYT